MIQPSSNHLDFEVANREMPASPAIWANHNNDPCKKYNNKLVVSTHLKNIS